MAVWNLYWFQVKDTACADTLQNSFSGLFVDPTYSCNAQRAVVGSHLWPTWVGWEIKYQMTEIAKQQWGKMDRAQDTSRRESK